ncbi:MAG TPA: PaaI family thioesterase [Solirubrobacteraceae bacterium]|nr:PaaI family thioesterase [Solirubrobacteraceae bacterium]
MPEIPSAEQLRELMPFVPTLGIELEPPTSERAAGSLPWAPELCTGGGIMHGGAILSLADTLGAVCAFMNLPPGAGTTTIESKTNFFRAVREGSVRGMARPMHVGRTTIVVQTELSDDEGRAVALTTQTQAVLGGG